MKKLFLIILLTLVAFGSINAQIERKKGKVGTKQVDESTIGNNKILYYDSTANKVKYMTASTISGLGSMTYADSTTYQGNTNLIKLGTVTTGTWNGSVIGDAYITKTGTWTGAVTSTGIVSGTTIALSGTDINTAGTLTNVAYNNAWGIPKNGMKFDGTDDHISIPYSNNLAFGDGTNDKPFSITAWVYIPSGGVGVILSNANSSGGNSWMYKISYDGGSLPFRFYRKDVSANANRGIYSNEGVMTEDRWYFIVATYDGDESVANAGTKMYINGVLTVTGNDNTGSYVAMEDNSWNNIIGASSAFSEKFTGEINQVLVFNKVLTQSEITTLYNNGRPDLTEVPYKYVGGSQTAQTSGTLIINKAYRINTYITGDDFTNVGGTNVSGNEFVVTGTTPTTWTNSSSLVEIGAVAEYKDFGSFGVVDNSPNRLNGNTSGSPISLSKGNEIEYVDYKGSITGATTLTDIVPAGYKLESILFENTTANAVTGGIKVGTTAGGTDVVSAATVGANAEGLMTLAKDFFSTSTDQTLYIDAVTAWNAASINLTFRFRKVK